MALPACGFITRQATVSVIPAASSLILKALNEPERDRKKVQILEVFFPFML